MRPAIRTRAVEDGEKAQRGVNDRAARAGEAAPPYVLVELIGKGSYGRVYKGEDTRTGEVVAVKVIDIDESDTASPRYADTYGEFLKEIGALKVLSEGKARNINHIIDVLPVGHTMWMVTEYCGGGSVATLMRPKPGGLGEKYIIPILREVAEALGWVHKAGIIHRDVKCANILITTAGAIQLCDFGVAATLSLPSLKRTTFIGTPHWMAPELFTSSSSSSSSSSPSYGVEVDIWAFGAVVYEVATGLPPNASSRIPYGQLESGVRVAVPRLEGEEYSVQLRGLAAYCLEEDPSNRPMIGEVQLHPYIHSTTLSYPTSALVDLITAFRIWEQEGGTRASLFMSGGASGPSEAGETEESGSEEWDFNSTLRASAAKDAGTLSENPQPTPRAKGGRRRPPKEVLEPLREPIERVFDANTLSNYEGNSRAHYFPSPSDGVGDLPLRERDEGGSRLRDVDGDETLKPPPLHPVADLDDTKRRTQDWTFASSLPTPLREAETEGDGNRRTKDWTFASSLPAPRESTDAVGEFSDGGGGYAHTPTRSARPIQMNRMSMGEGLIDLDMSLSPSPQMSSQQAQSHASVAESLIDLDMSLSPSQHPPSQYPASRASTAEPLIDLDMSVPRSPPAEQTAPSTPTAHAQTVVTRTTTAAVKPGSCGRELPAPPSVEALSGVAGVEVMRSEMGRLLGGLVVELGVVRDVLAGPGVI
ncbi:hypothetical protein VE01_03300 [Pseudogymnoascus verrucosus]|uniref:non-specific serine/threonine protein kinase n=1 Tax=Pseudogymnoascus verrucosus TaxID=342668 RepID=A0A1B8GSE6_9PEZI|nr:uncharacterized protein VE01_03300 [Pseudogymnoascus verrucosus]OBT98762.1 hypothetical protein VE01_03300 [Pseudogymnoascus verrucosus]